MPDDHTQRLNKYLALVRGISRREADDLIAGGRIMVNDTSATLGARIGPDDQISLDGHLLARSPIPPIYLLFHKPVGYVCSRRQQGATPTIYALIPEQYHHLKPVGRLDRDSSGLILLTNDGDFAHTMTHPSYHKTKIYRVTLDRPLAPLHQQMIADFGVILEDGKSQFGVSRVEDAPHTYEITMHEGRNRQIRRTFTALGYTVTQLHRTHFGRFAIANIKQGAYQLFDMHPSTRQ